jgi:hypothetical protein
VAPPFQPLPPLERAFLLGALFHGALDVERLRALAAGGLDWDALTAAAERHALGALLFDSIHTAGLGPSAPAPLLARLRAVAALVASRNATFQRAAGRACQLLSSGGIESMAIKGAALALHAPGYFALRAQSDVDLLVSRDRVRSAARLLHEQGFTVAPVHADLLGLDGGSPLEEGSPFPPGQHHLLPLASPEGVTVELHFDLPGHLPPETLAAVRADLATGPGGLRTQGRDALLGLLCAHVHAHHEREPIFLLRHVADVVALLSTGASLDTVPPAFGPFSERSRILVEDARRSVARPGRAAPGLAESALAHGPWSARSLLAARRSSFRGRWWYLVEGGLGALFPAPRFMAQRYGIGPRSPLLPFTYPWRVLSAIWRALLGR